MNRYVSHVAMAAALLCASAAGPAYAQRTDQKSERELLEDALQELRSARQELQDARKDVELLKQQMRHIADERASGTGQFIGSIEPPKKIGRAQAFRTTMSDPAGQIDRIRDEAEAIEKMCPITPASAKHIIDYPKPFASECLAPIDQEKGQLKTRWNRFDSLRLGINLIGSKNDSVVEMTPSYTKRWMVPRRHGSFLQPPEACDQQAHSKCPGFRSNYVTVKAGVAVPLDPGGQLATFADLTKFERASGLTAIFGVEWGDSRWTDEGKAVTNANKVLAAARSECIAEKRSEPEPAPPEPGSAVPTMRLRTSSEVIGLCDGMALTDWMSEDKERRQKYYGKLVQRPLYQEFGSEADKAPPPKFFAGMEGRYSTRSKYTFVPLLDGNGDPVEEPPSAIAGNEVNQTHDLYSLKGYAGVGLPGDTLGGGIITAGDISASLTYRRDFTFGKKVSDQIVCDSSETVIRCDKKNIGPPIKLQGLVAGARIAAEFPTFGFLPTSAAEVRGTYDFQSHRAGLQVPIYFIVNGKDRPHGGVMLSCTGRGQLHGQTLERDCKGAIFVGTEFQLNRR